MESSRSATTTPVPATIAALLTWAVATGCAQLDAQLLLARALGRPRSFLYAEPDVICPEQALHDFRASIERRLGGEPLAYITGEREFWSLPLKVGPEVLVPRPETELLVELVLAMGPNGPAQVLDLGTGSGAIALALASQRRQWQLTATDASPDALRIAAANGRALGLDHCEFLAGSWFAPLPQRRFDVIVSNPPYIEPGDPALQDAVLRHEPPQALFSPPDGLSALREIIAGARQHLAANGLLALEHGFAQGAAVAALLSAAGFGSIQCHADLAGLPRATTARMTASRA